MDYELHAFEYRDARAKIALISEHLRIERIQGAGRAQLSATADRADEHIERLIHHLEILAAAN